MADKAILGTTDDGASVSAVVGDTLLLELEENPTTGYRWDAASAGSILELIDDDFTVGEGIGAGGIRRLRFIARSPGQLTLSLPLVRSWERDQPLRIWSARVSVTP